MHWLMNERMNELKYKKKIQKYVDKQMYRFLNRSMPTYSVCLLNNYM